MSWLPAALLRAGLRLQALERSEGLGTHVLFPAVVATSLDCGAGKVFLALSSTLSTRREALPGLVEVSRAGGAGASPG